MPASKATAIYTDLFPRTGETPETARHVIEAVLKPKVIGRDRRAGGGRVRSRFERVLTRLRAER